VTGSDEELREGAVVRVGGARVGCANLWPRARDGGEAMSAIVAVEGERHVVFVGSELAIEGERYRVRAIDKTPGAPGRVRIARITAPRR
jgi:hypothetical protein